MGVLFYSNERERLVCNFCEAVDAAVIDSFGENRLVLYGGSTMYINKKWGNISPLMPRRVTDIDFSIHTPEPVTEKEAEALTTKVKEWLQDVAKKSGFEVFEEVRAAGQKQVFFLLRTEEASIHVNFSGVNRMSMEPVKRIKLDGSESNLYFLKPLDHLAYKIARIINQADSYASGNREAWQAPQDFIDVVNIMASGLSGFNYNEDIKKVEYRTQDVNLLRMLVVAKLAGMRPSVGVDAYYANGKFMPDTLQNSEELATIIQPLTMGRLEDLNKALTSKVCKQLVDFFSFVCGTIFPDGKMNEKEIECLRTIGELRGESFDVIRNKAADILAEAYPQEAALYPQIISSFRRDSMIMYEMIRANNELEI